MFIGDSHMKVKNKRKIIPLNGDFHATVFIR